MSPHQLSRRFTLIDASAIMVGSMIGSGIYLKPPAIAKLLGSPLLVVCVWIFAGLLTLLGALCYAELGAAWPRSGGLYTYLLQAYGRLPAFLFGWSMLAILQTGSIAGLAAGVAQATSRLVPLTDVEQLRLAAVLIVAVSLLNLLSVKAGARVQNVLTGAKSFGLVFLIVGGLGWGHPQASNLLSSAPAASGLALLSAFGLAVVKALWAYDGWVNVTYVAGEVQAPQRNMPRALLLGTGFVIAVYVMANLAYHLVLPLSLVQASTSVGAEVARVVLGPIGLILMSYLIIASTFGTLNSSVLSGPRVTFAMAQDHLFFAAAAKIHPRFGSPYVAIIVQGAWALMLLARWQTFDAITDNVIFIYWLFYALGAGAVKVLRRKAPDDPRPYRTFGYPVVPCLFIAVAIALSVNTVVQSIVQHRADALEALGLLALGLVIYPFFQRLR